MEENDLNFNEACEQVLKEFKYVTTENVAMFVVKMKTNDTLDEIRHSLRQMLYTSEANIAIKSLKRFFENTPPKLIAEYVEEDYDGILKNIDKYRNIHNNFWTATDFALALKRMAQSRQDYYDEKAQEEIEDSE